jgi:hypothetical protein
MKTEFTREYFLSELLQLRKWLGDKDFWNGDKPSNAMRGLLYVYVNTNDLTESDITQMTSIKEEYDTRLSLMIAHGIYK